MDIKKNNILEFSEQKDQKTARIIKCQRKDNFTRIYNDCINDKDLSGEALAVLVYIMSKPEDWVVYINDLCIRFKRSPNKIYTLVNELINLGYMRRYQPRDKSGMVLPWVTEASDEPIFKNAELLEPRALLPHINLPHAVKTGRGKMNTTKKEYTKKDNKQKNNNKDYNSNLTKTNSSITSITESTVEPDGSVVVALMEKIKHLAISKVLVTSWLKKHGVAYVAEKIQLMENQKPNSSERFLNKAITQDWKPALPRPPENKQKNPKEPAYPSHEENVVWYNSLSKQEKLKYLQMACSTHYAFEGHLKFQQISVLDATFPSHSLFKMFMSLLGRGI